MWGPPRPGACDDDATGAQGDIPGDHLDLCRAMIAGVKDFAGSYLHHAVRRFLEILFVPWRTEAAETAQKLDRSSLFRPTIINEWA